MKTFKIFPVFILLTVIFFPKCNTTEPPPETRKLTLTFEDGSCTEVWLRLEAENISLPAEAVIKTDDTLSQNIILSSADTTIYLDSLFPNKTYTIQAFIQSSNQSQVSSNEVTATTMDTTSHNFTWQTFTFGEHSSSVLYDVAIINENNIWAVGEIYMNDSLGQPDPNFYNVIHFDGNEWEPMRLLTNCRIYFPECGPETLGIAPAKAIFAFNENDIWIAAGNIFHFNGIEWARLAGTGPENGSANKIWGCSSNDIYFVGNNGFISHYNGTSWQRIQSGTDLDIYDIWGDDNKKTNELEILAVAAKIGVNFEKKILKINKTSGVTSLSTNGIPYSIHGIWFKNRTYYIVGSGMYKKYDINSSTNWNALHQGITNYYLNAIRGNDLNDILICGSFGELLHFNGINWKSYQEIFSGILLGEISIKNNLIVIVGFDYPKAFLAFGKR